MSEPTGSKPTVDYSRTTSIGYVAVCWSKLPPHVREAIVTLVDAGLMTPQSASQSSHSEEGRRQ